MTRVLTPSLFSDTPRAFIDETGQYRYFLTREWDADKPRVCFIMLNPSVADAERDDPTIRRCIGFARAWGAGSLEVVNLFAYRATDPEQLLTAADPIGPENDAYIAKAVKRASQVIVAWGAHAAAYKERRAICVLDSLVSPLCLDITKEGYPRHPLYIKGMTKPTVYKVPLSLQLSRLETLPEKGAWGGVCYRRVCDNHPACWFNKSTRKHYCETCARLINRANQADTLRLYGTLLLCELHTANGEKYNA